MNRPPQSRQQHRHRPPRRNRQQHRLAVAVGSRRKEGGGFGPRFTPMSDDSLWCDYDHYDFDPDPLTGEAYKAALDDDTLDAMDYLAAALEVLKK